MCCLVVFLQAGTLTLNLSIYIQISDPFVGLVAAFSTPVLTLNFIFDIIIVNQLIVKVFGPIYSVYFLKYPIL